MSTHSFHDAIAESLIRDRAYFDRLDRNRYEVRVLNLLADGEISVGKACESLRHWISDGKRDTLPDDLKEPPL